MLIVGPVVSAKAHQSKAKSFLYNVVTAVQSKFIFKPVIKLV